jgi:hypothetical protein
MGIPALSFHWVRIFKVFLKHCNFSSSLNAPSVITLYVFYLNFLSRMTLWGWISKQKRNIGVIWESIISVPEISTTYRSKFYPTNMNGFSSCFQGGKHHFCFLWPTLEFYLKTTWRGRRERLGTTDNDSRLILSWWRLRKCIQKFPDWPPGARTANGTVLCH